MDTKEQATEHELAVWLEEQIVACAEGELSVRQIETLTDGVPGWLTAYTQDDATSSALIVSAALEHYPEALVKRAATPVG